MCEILAHAADPLWGISMERRSSRRCLTGAYEQAENVPYAKDLQLRSV